jgi:hypothetical protein
LHGLCIDLKRAGTELQDVCSTDRSYKFEPERCGLAVKSRLKSDEWAGVESRFQPFTAAVHTCAVIIGGDDFICDPDSLAEIVGAGFTAFHV